MVLTSERQEDKPPDLPNWTFNIADSAISCGIVFLILLMFLQHRTLDPVDLPGATENKTSELAG